jgi:uncharacterized protein YbjQ (UPF0145 family)
MPRELIVTTGDRCEGYEVVQYLGLVRGIVVRATGPVRSLLGGLKSMIGGNVGAYEQVCEEAREQALERMMQHAAEHGADAILAMRYDATEFMDGITEVLAYGTAVKIRPVQ